MNSPLRFRFVCFAVAAGATFHAHAASFTSVASSAGSASSGSVSGSLRGSSKSSTHDEKTAGGDYRITDVAQVPDRAGFQRVTMQSEDGQRLVLDLPAKVSRQQRLVRGDLVHAQRRVYGLEFSRGDTRDAFYLVLADDWYGELATRPVASL